MAWSTCILYSLKIRSGVFVSCVAWSHVSASAKSVHSSHSPQDRTQYWNHHKVLGTILNGFQSHFLVEKETRVVNGAIFWFYQWVIGLWEKLSACVVSSFSHRLSRHYLWSIVNGNSLRLQRYRRALHHLVATHVAQSCFEKVDLYSLETFNLRCSHVCKSWVPFLHRRHRKFRTIIRYVQ